MLREAMRSKVDGDRQFRTLLEVQWHRDGVGLEVVAGRRLLHEFLGWKQSNADVLSIK